MQRPTTSSDLVRTNSTQLAGACYGASVEACMDLSAAKCAIGGAASALEHV
jgi:hypothetical protein